MKHTPRLLVFALALCPLFADARESSQIAVMVHRPSNRLAWNAVDDRAAFMLACDRILSEHLRQTSALHTVGAYRVNGIVRGMSEGLYYPSGETLHEKWRPFVEADVYVECDLSRERLQWRAGTAGGDELESEVVDRPWQHPMACAAALVRLVFEAGEVPLSPEQEEALHVEEPSPPDLFIEWAKWIGYRPHWLHHAPWQGPQTSAKRILKEDPGFSRGAAWAFPMLMRVPKDQPKSPATLFYLPQALTLVDSPHCGGAFSFLRKQAKDKDTLRDLLVLLGVSELDLGGGIDIDLDGPGGIGEEMPGRQDVGRAAEQTRGARFRHNLVLAVGSLKAKPVKNALLMVLKGDADANVRAAAADMLAAHHRGVTDALREAFDTDKSADVRARALTGLIKLEAFDPERVRAASEDPHATVRTALAKRLHGCPVEEEEKTRLWRRFLDDPSVDVRQAAIQALHRHTDSAPSAEGVKPSLLRALGGGEAPEQRAALRWLVDSPHAEFAASIRPLLEAEAGAVRAAAARALAKCAAARIPEILERLSDDGSYRVQRSLARVLAEVDQPYAFEAVFDLLERSRPEAREAICSAAYQVIGDDRAPLARAMRYDPSLMVNLASLRLATRLGEPELLADLLGWCARDHRKEYIRAKALRLMEERNDERTRAFCLDALSSPFWVVRLEAADILGRLAMPEDAERIRAAGEGLEDQWLAMALEDALCKAEERPKPDRVELNLGEREHTEGGHSPGGFQTWIDAPPEDPAKARALVEEGWRFGVKNYPPNVPGGTTLNNMNNNISMRNIHLLESILDPLENKWKAMLPHLYYIALFDEPFALGTFYHPERIKAMLLEAGRTDLLAGAEGKSGDELGRSLPPDLRRAYDWYNAKFGGIASNWAVHMFRLTAQRKYPGLQIFPQSLSYMRKHTDDAFNMIEADGDYSWIYHYGNFFRDGTIGAVNRVINPGKPLCMITWMGWHKPNIIRGNTLYLDTNYPDGPWRIRDYMGTRSGLALWATGTEAAFFDHIGFGTASNKDAKSLPMRAFQLKPWSEPAKRAVRHMMNDNIYWKGIEGKLAVQDLKERGGVDSTDLSMQGMDTAEFRDMSLGGGPTPLEKALQEKKDEKFEELMTGVSYMNIFNTDTTRALSNLPKPDTRKRDSLIIHGRDSHWYADGPHFRIPATAVLAGFDMVPNYDCIGHADLMHYDTILLQSSRDGVTSELVQGINHWLRNKDGGLLIVWGACSSDNVLFPSLTLDEVDAPFLWEDTVEFQRPAWIEETYKDRRGRQHTRTVRPPLEAFRRKGGDEATASGARLDTTFSGNVAPILTTAGGDAVLARWQAPDAVRSVVLFDGASGAGPAYTEALEEAILALDRERGSTVKRNPWWGHTIYENDQFVVDVATSQLRAFHDARPRQHKGVDVITGVINPRVHHGECAMILKDYVGPYAGGKGNWAVMARQKLKEMTLETPQRLRVEAAGVTRITHIGEQEIRLANAADFEEVKNQVVVWKRMREGKPAYSRNALDGGRELHVYSPTPIVVEAK